MHIAEHSQTCVRLVLRTYRKASQKTLRWFRLNSETALVTGQLYVKLAFFYWLPSGNAVCGTLIPIRLLNFLSAARLMSSVLFKRASSCACKTT